MMIYIDIPMPEHCYDCPCHDGESGFCQITGKYYCDEIPRSCPLVELPSVQPEPCEDAVSRNEVFNVIEDVAYDVDAGVDSWYGLMNNKVKALQSVQQERKKDDWIPCSERMPEERRWVGTREFGTTISDEVYVTFENPKGERFCKHLSFQNGKLGGYDQSHIDVWYKGSKPIAWKPLPEPYRGEQDNRSK